MARVRQPRGEIAIVGQDEQSLGLEIESADRVEVLANADEIHHGRPVLGVGSRRHVTPRLVQKYVAPRFDERNSSSVHADVVVVRLRAQLAHGDPIHHDTPVQHEPLGGAA